MLNLIRVLAIGGAIASVWLVRQELRTGSFCPRLPSIPLPACYLVLLAFVGVFSATFLARNRRALLFHPSALLGLGLAIWFSYLNFTGQGKCPVFQGIPLCYVSLGLFAVLELAFTRGGRIHA